MLREALFAVTVGGHVLHLYPSLPFGITFIILPPTNNHSTTWTSISHTINSCPSSPSSFSLPRCLDTFDPMGQLVNNIITYLETPNLHSALIHPTQIFVKDYCLPVFKIKFARTSFAHFALYVASKSLKTSRLND